MCTTCGCGDEAGTRISNLAGELQTPGPGYLHSHSDEHGRTYTHEHSHQHAHADSHDHHHGHADGHHHADPGTETILLEQNLLAKNDLLAATNRGWLAGRGVRAFNVMSSPGAGKTTLLVRTLAELGGRLKAGVIEGDQETSLDADRIRATGRPVIQINTGAGCHLDAGMLRHGLDALSPEAGSTVFIENVGNLVCPALFDLGETAKVVIVSVTEGDDKPQKYPHMFMAADLVIVNKSDLLPYVDFDVDECLRRIRQINPRAEFLTLSATTGEGLADWYGWLDGATSPAAAPTPGAARSESLTGSLTEAH
ncbi:hydrogenase nickel incorporation protein HypB [Arthrobacter globiformis NBRC 12137]|jgi:hydrogenase nickel incorporation protein HypB|uniref:Hydrogenase nickel incorporation protein HypB n=1 Tax=Arthrobacter globiformis (strain ATCC 8010 / DSM 20124 / JCM 1332 / NBRC 12137 / NCIMB 8907 / NRRL B-2979 / 168) TaxID=1077972 RepID=H0QLQ7_ARTG1|nr:hydrogenase nickel incorporation protein HypB [Arthrobacter globiformis]GAB13758.1 hydrogenase nickel incorporation protein HypB [Arthrobacter globiformis NBRC 12137]